MQTVQTSDSARVKYEYATTCANVQTFRRHEYCI